jgi:hypothetical protein
MKAINFKKVSIAIPVLSIILFWGCDTNVRQYDDNYNPVIKQENFSHPVINPYKPLTPGSKLTYQVTENGEVTETIVIKVLFSTKNILGIDCKIVRDTVTVKDDEGNDILLEDTYDWYATDNQGNVWYMGEDVKNYDENGNFTNNNGSFEAGVDEALPGIVMFMNPVVELPYRQEYYFENAEDWGKVLSLDEDGIVANGTTYNDCIKTRDWNALDTDGVIELKYFAPNTGFIKEVKEDSSEEVVLIGIDSFTEGSEDDQ